MKHADRRPCTFAAGMALPAFSPGQSLIPGEVLHWVLEQRDVLRGLAMKSIRKSHCSTLTTPSPKRQQLITSSS